MNIFLFILGAGFGMLMLAIRPTKRRGAPKLYQNDQLDTLDEMYLHGEVNNDDFYRMWGKNE